MKTYISISFAFLISLFISSCDDFGDTNLDPTRPGGDNVSLVAITPTMQTQTHRNLVSSAGRIAGIFMQQYEGFDAQQVAFTQYAVDEGTLANFWEFGLYTGSMRDCVDMIERANAQGDVPHTRGLARIYLAANLGLTTNLWGDIPYSEAFKGADNLSPSYDSQEEIYNTIQLLLDDAIADFGEVDPQGPLGDLVNADWVATAHALKARYYLQLSKRNPNAASDALDELALAFNSNESAPIFEFEDTPNGGNPLALFGVQRPNTLIISPFFDNITNGDPRKDSYMVPNSDGDQLFFQNGNPDLFWAQFSSPSPLISYTELKFIEAEALFRTGGDPLPALEDAIIANMEFIGIASGDSAAYIAAIGGVADLETIITEKYKALFGSNPIQVWNDFRRTGFPALTPNAEGANGSNPSGVVPRRILYPDSERLSNTAAYDAAILNQGGHLLDVDIWAFQD